MVTIKDAIQRFHVVNYRTQTTSCTALSFLGAKNCLLFTEAFSLIFSSVQLQISYLLNKSPLKAARCTRNSVSSLLLKRSSQGLLVPPIRAGHGLHLWHMTSLNPILHLLEVSHAPLLCWSSSLLYSVSPSFLIYSFTLVESLSFSNSYLRKAV